VRSIAISLSVCLSSTSQGKQVTANSYVALALAPTSLMNSADRRSLQFTINTIVYKIFGAVSKDLYTEISAHFGIESVENLVANRRNRFIDAHLRP